MARANGGIIGKTNKTSFGKCKVTTVTATGCHTTQPGTQLVKAFVVGGGGSGSSDRGGGGGAGGVRTIDNIPVGAGAGVPVVVGGGGNKVPGPGANGNVGNVSNIVSACYQSAGGGAGVYASCAPSSVKDGGSGGGGLSTKPGGAGNVPSVTPPQGNPGGGYPSGSSGYLYGGGGAGGAGGQDNSGPGGNGGTGVCVPEHSFSERRVLR